MKTYQITLNGCDDSTEIKMKLTEDEYAVVAKVRDRLNKVSDNGCQPSMKVWTRQEEREEVERRDAANRGAYKRWAKEQDERNDK